MTQDIPKAIKLESQEESLRVAFQFILKQQYTIQELKKDILSLPSKNPAVGWHNDPDWEEYHMHMKNNATAKAREVMLRMRRNYGFE